MKILVCVLAAVSTASAGVVNTIPGNAYNGAQIIHSPLGADCHTSYGQGIHGQYLHVFPQAGHSTLGDITGLTNYANYGTQQLQFIQGQNHLSPSTLFNQNPLTYTTVGDYGAIHSGVQTVHLVQQPVVATAHSPVFQTVRIIQDPTQLVPINAGIRTVKFVQTPPTFEKVQTIRVVKEPVPIPEVTKTVRVVHERIPFKSIKNTRVIQEPIHPVHQIHQEPLQPPPVHHHPIPPQSAPVQPLPVHQLPPHPHPPHSQLSHPHPPHSHPTHPLPHPDPTPAIPLPDVTVPGTPEIPSGYQYSFPQKNLKSRV